MARAQVDEDNRALNFLFDDLSHVPEDERNVIEKMFPVYFDNPDLVLDTTSNETRDFIVENGKARYDPTPESVEAIEKEFNEVVKQAKVDGLLDYLETNPTAI